jgi:hypothetical protein
MESTFRPRSISGIHVPSAFHWRTIHVPFVFHWRTQPSHTPQPKSRPPAHLCGILLDGCLRAGYAHGTRRERGWYANATRMEHGLQKWYADGTWVQEFATCLATNTICIKTNCPLYCIILLSKRTSNYPTTPTPRVGGGHWGRVWWGLWTSVWMSVRTGQYNTLDNYF